MQVDILYVAGRLTILHSYKEAGTAAEVQPGILLLEECKRNNC